MMLVFLYGYSDFIRHCRDRYDKGNIYVELQPSRHEAAQLKPSKRA